MVKAILKRIVTLVFAVAWRKLDSIKQQVSKYIVSTLLRTGERIVKALLDDNNNNAEQMKQIGKEEAGVVVDELTQVAKGKIEAFKDKELREALLVYLDGASKLVKLLIDDNPDNEAQVKAHWQEIKPAVFNESYDVFISKAGQVLEKKVEDEFLRQTILEILESLRDILGGEL
ncbi:MAG: hypothetical protein D6706_20075 [Chloroflexi bacterium]|nr:MAG: hypothetical protein D6706_20075 [Chloroflexota bacterium]